MKKKLTVKSIDIISTFTICILLLDIPYLNHISSPRMIKMMITIFVLFCDVIYASRHKIQIRTEHWLLLLSTLCVLITTAIHDGAIISCLSDFSTVIAMCFLIVISQSAEQIIRIYKSWCKVFFVLMLIDTFTIIVWPGGLYRGTFIRNNWFLGYKTARLTYTFTLLLFYNYAELLSNENLSWKSYLLAAFVFVNTYLSNASGAAIAVGVYSLMVFFAFGQKKRYIARVLQKRTLWLINHHIWIFCVWLILYAIIVVFYNTTLVQSFISQMEKEYSFGQRTLAWANTLSTIKNNWLFGVGIQSRESTMQITGGFANAHNTVFTYLLSGGIIGLVILSYIAYSSLRHTLKCSENYPVLVYFYCIMFLGLVSSALAFCPILFAAVLLPLKSYHQTRKSAG